MVIQNIVFPDAAYGQETEYFHTDGKVSPENNTVFLNKGEYFSTYAYMNILDIRFWKKYTNVRDITLRLFTVGKGELNIYIKKEEETEIFKHLEYTAGELDIDLSESEEGYVYFSITAEEPSCLLKAFYSSEIREPNEVRIAAAAACMNGNSESMLKAPEENRSCAELKIYSEEGSAQCTLFDTLLSRIREDAETLKFTHVVFMTDEGEYGPEGFIRLYAFLSMVKEEYKDRPVAGDASCGAYCSWHLCAYPAGYALENRPFAFYRGEGSAEYGLRYGIRPLSVRGFESIKGYAEKEKSPEDIYYEIRSELIVDIMENYEADFFPVVGKWNARYKTYKDSGRKMECYCCALALKHASKLRLYRKNSGMAPAGSFRILKKIHILKPAAALLKGISLVYLYIGYPHFRDSLIEIRRKRRWQ